MKTIYTLASIAAFLLLIPISIASYKDCQVLRNGKLVKVELTYISRVHQFIRFKMNNTIYDKKIDSYSSFSHNIGDTLSMRYLRGYENTFLYSDENPMFWNLLLALTLLFCGVGCLYYMKKGVKLW